MNDPNIFSPVVHMHKCQLCPRRIDHLDMWNGLCYNCAQELYNDRDCDPSYLENEDGNI